MDALVNFSKFVLFPLKFFKKFGKGSKLSEPSKNALVNFSDFVQFPLKCFKIFGLVPYESTKTVESRKKKLLKKLFKVYHHLVITNLIMSVIMMVVFVKQNVKNLTLITEAVPATGYALLAVIKAIMIFARKEEFKDLMETLSELFPKTKEEQSIFKVGKYFRGYKRMERGFSLLAGSTGVVFVAVPIVRFVMTGVWIDELPFHNWFPFDELDVRYYNFVLLWEFNNTIHTIVSILGPDLILYSFITLISMQFDILNSEFEMLKNMPEKDIFEKLIKLVKDHENLMRLPKQLDKIYSVSILFNFITSSVLICLVGYQVSIGISLEILTKFASLLMASVVQVFILCYYGNKLTTAGGNVADGIYASGWHELHDRKIKKALVLIMQRAQKPCTITALKFAVVSLASFTTVMNTSYSYFTLLQTINKPAA